MARFDVYRNTGAHASGTPYLLDVQGDLLQNLETRVVVPMRRRDRFPDVSLPGNLVPAFEVEGIQCIMETPKLAAIPRRLLKVEVASLAERRFEIVAALDLLFQGF